MLLYLTATGIGFFLIAFIVKILRIHFYSLATSSVSLVNVLLLKIKEDEKVKLVQETNNKLLLSLAKVLLTIIVALAVGSIPFIIYIIIKGQSFDDLNFSSTSSIIALTVGSTLGFIVPVKKKDLTSYSELSQLLHRIALNNYAVAYKLFKLEAKKLPKKGVIEKGKFVIVSGLARSGTTSLMNKLTENDSLASLSYANMPFLTAPNLWKKIYQPKDSKKEERSHKDGIMIGLDSNEALEEYFLKVISNDSYINEDKLLEYSLTEEQYSDYIKYQAIVKNDNQKIYLAKNNNFILRYSSIREFNKEFLVIFMFRDPLIHAASLLEKHKYYISLQKKDSFVLEYMNWLGHHEFGLNQKAFQFDDNNQNYIADKNSIDYWLQIWINYYNYLLTIDQTGVDYVDYDNYCKQPNEVLDKIFKKAGVKAVLPMVTPFDNKRKVELDCSEELKLKAYSIYSELKTMT